MENKKIQAVIVVEGKKDTQRLRLIDPEVRTIETRGAAVNSELISLIKKVNQKEEVIILTDPDFSGERIRRLISTEIPGIKQAFLRQKDAIPGKKQHRASLGVEHASTSAILGALAQGSETAKKRTDLISQSDLMKLKLLNSPEARHRRKFVSNYFNLGYVNGAHLASRLQLLGVTLNELEKILSENYDG
ncbi:ribonuclease M5 [Xylocopilactobacillus apicola]|uniref:Ribonuclease M5 n=1 Tax=Xylocopilactobacillus apicola TaxID=2932184 RepID=A0AAU9DN29_9LACO|nr:ribonuclease M5 [Xylocopilactobacillus apicola]BDR58437.1 ribonuclease M5 [Xylocopilactobacillus apicola]